MVRTSGMILSKWKISTIKRRRLCLFTVCETLRRLVVECHSHILCSLCGTSLLTLASSILNSISIRRRKVPWWFALMSQSISFFLPTEAFHREIKFKHQAATLNHPRAERLIQFEHLVSYSKILGVCFFFYYHPARQPSGTGRQDGRSLKVWKGTSSCSCMITGEVGNCAYCSSERCNKIFVVVYKPSSNTKKVHLFTYAYIYSTLRQNEHWGFILFKERHWELRNWPE